MLCVSIDLEIVLPRLDVKSDKKIETKNSLQLVPQLIMINACTVKNKRSYISAHQTSSNTANKNSFFS
jgi:hypothetical protein